MTVKTLINYYSNVDVEKIKKLLKIEVAQNKKNLRILNLIEFPELILNERDLYFQEQRSKLGNYVTTKIVHGEIINFEKIKDYNSLSEKVVLLKNADPGYDFIFSRRDLY